VVFTVNEEKVKYQTEPYNDNDFCAHYDDLRRNCDDNYNVRARDDNDDLHRHCDDGLSRHCDDNDSNHPRAE
jgi:hypothetical protein